MKSIIQNIHKAFESRVRLGIMSALVVSDASDFKTLKQTLNVTDGNLASHIAALENEGYVRVKKEFVGKKPLTTYMLTASGRKAFNEHIDALENLIKMSS